MKAPLTPDVAAARTFLQRLAPDDVITFQTFDDSKAGKNRSLARVLHGPLDQHIDALSRLNRQGAGIFAMVNRGDGQIHDGFSTCRSAKSVVAVRALFVDLDGAPVDPVLNASEPPDIVVESSPGRWHAYWLTNDCPLGDFTPLQKCIAHKFGGDPAVCDLPRVMRLPGFWHQKAEPFLTRTTSPE